MAKPTPLLKGLITLVVLSSAVAAGWHLFHKDNKTGDAPVAATQSAPAEKSGGGLLSGVKSAFSSKASGPLGSAGNPLKVSLVSFHGYAPALVANGNSLKTQAQSIFDRQGLNVEFLIQDDIPALATLFESGTAQCAWRTSDFWAQEHPNLRNAGHDGKVIMAVDNTQGGDAIIARDPAIRSVEDLAGRSLAMLQFTPSHGMAIDAIENSALSAKKKSSVKMVFINADEGTPGVRAAFEAGKVDAVALWDPDLSLALRAPGAHVVYSTKTATNLIYDVIVCDARMLKTPEGADAAQKLVSGWMEGVVEAKANPEKAVDALVATQEMFGLLEKSEGRAFIRQIFTNLVWTDLEQNGRIFGLNGQSGHYDRVYRRFDDIYRAAGALANPNAPVIDPSDSVDTRFIQTLLDRNQSAKQAMTKPEYQFSEREQAKVVNAAPAMVTKLISVGFQSGSAELTKKAEQTIDREMVPFIENNGSAYFELSGNSDSVGSADINQRLSVMRAEAVKKYLVTQWEIPAARFKVVGYGSSKPLCPEHNPGAEGLDLEGCRAMNRSTRLSVFAR